MNWKDPAWWSLIVAALALVFSVPSALLAWKSLEWERSAADAATRSAEAAERANLLTERTLARSADDAAADALRRRLDDMMTDLTTLTGESDEIPIFMSNAHSIRSSPEDVRWEIQHSPGGSRYILRNVGSDIAEHVSVDPEQVAQLGGFARSMPSDAVIRPGEGVDFLVLSAWGNPAPNQLYIRWNDRQEYVAVPMPG